MRPDDDATAVEPRRRVDVKICRGRPTARVLRSPREVETATDFDVVVTVSSHPATEAPEATDRRCEGEISLWRGARSWQPCRSTMHGPDAGWIHGSQLPAMIADLRREAPPIGVDVSRRLVEVLAGIGWPDRSPHAGSAARDCLGTYHETSIELHRDAIVPGDVVDHANSRRRGIVVRVGRICPDATVEHLVRASSQVDRDTWEEDGETWWNSGRLHLVRRGPYRKYLAMVALEDDADRRVRRGRRPRQRYGGSLAPSTWDAMYWRLCNSRRVGIDGQTTYVDLGRERWSVAAVDCLERRDHAQHTSWLDSAGRSLEASSSSPFESLLRIGPGDP